MRNKSKTKQDINRWLFKNTPLFLSFNCLTHKLFYFSLFTIFSTCTVSTQETGLNQFSAILFVDASGADMTNSLKNTQIPKQ